MPLPPAKAEEIKQRMAARMEARQIVELITTTHGAYRAHEQEAFTTALRNELNLVLASAEAKVDVEPMSDEVARRFGNNTMGFGKYVGQRIDEIPIDYLLWFVEQKDTFKQELRRYIKSRRVQAEIEETH